MGVLSYSCLLHAVSASAELVDDDVITLVLENEYRKESMAAAEASLERQERPFTQVCLDTVI